MMPAFILIDWGTCRASLVPSSSPQSHCPESDHFCWPEEKYRDASSSSTVSAGTSQVVPVICQRRWRHLDMRTMEDLVARTFNHGIESMEQSRLHNSSLGLSPLSPVRSRNASFCYLFSRALLNATTTTTTSPTATAGTPCVTRLTPLTDLIT